MYSSGKSNVNLLVSQSMLKICRCIVVPDRETLLKLIYLPVDTKKQAQLEKYQHQSSQSTGSSTAFLLGTQMVLSLKLKSAT